MSTTTGTGGAVRPVADSARATLARSALIAVALTTAAVGGLLAALPPEGVGTVGATGAAVCLVVALATGSRLRLGSTTARGDELAAVLGAAAAFLGVTAVQLLSHLRGPWSAQLVLGLLVVAATGVALPLQGMLGAGLGVAGLLVAETVTGVTSDTLSGTRLSAGLRVTDVALAAAAIGVAVHLLRREAAVVDRQAAALDEAEAESRAAREAAQAAEEWQRTLHDTALNTLEAVAVHGELLDPGAVAVRCSQDVAVLESWLLDEGEAASPDLRAALDAAAAWAGQALALDVTVQVCSPPPRAQAAVVVALAGAARESLLNVAKHAGVAAATLRLDAWGQDGVALDVVDSGRGPAGAARGFGLRHSVSGRLEAVGGHADLVAPPEGGTVVQLRWAPTPATMSPAPGLDLGRIAAWTGVAAAGVSGLALLAGWASYTRPVAAAAAWALPFVWVLILLSRRRRPDGGEVVVTCLVYAASVLAGLAADPWCSSVVGEATVLDARLPMLAAVVLWRPRRAVLAGTVGTVLATHAMVALQWRRAFELCGTGSLVVGLLVALVLVLCGIVGRSWWREQQRWVELRARTVASQADRRRLDLVTAEQRSWTHDTLRRTLRVLSAVVAQCGGPDGTLDPATRETCAQHAGAMRALLALGADLGPVSAALRGFVAAVARSGGSVVVRGRVDGLAPPAAAAESILAAVAAVPRSGSWVVLGWRSTKQQGLSLSGRLELPAAGVVPASGSGWRFDIEDDEAVTVLLWEWEIAASEVMAPRPGLRGERE